MIASLETGVHAESKNSRRSQNSQPDFEDVPQVGEEDGSGCNWSHFRFAGLQWQFQGESGSLARSFALGPQGSAHLPGGVGPRMGHFPTSAGQITP
jgi:hypothetical protein